MTQKLALGSLLLRVAFDEPHRVQRWSVATRLGRAVDLQAGRLLVGDGSLDGVLGSDEHAEWFPMMGLARGSGVEWEWPSGDEAGHLLPGSRLRSYYLADRGIKVNPPRNFRPAGARAWLGLDEDGTACEVVIDLASIFRAQPYDAVDDAWSVTVEAGPGRLTSEAVCQPEAADLAAAFVSDEREPQLILGLGSVALSGQLYAYDPLYLQNPLQLPVEVPTGSYPAFALVKDHVDLLLLRLGAARPAQWLEYSGTEERGPYIQIEAGMYAISSDETWRAVSGDDALRDDMRTLATSLHLDTAALESDPRLGFVVNGDTGGDLPAWCYIGLDSDGAVSAIAVALVTDVVYGHRPAASDESLLEQLRQRVSELAEGEDPEEIQSYYWPRIEAATTAESPVSTETRALMYQLQDLLDKSGVA